MAEGTVGRSQHALAENAAMGVDERERGVVADRADVAEMIGDALDLGHDATQDPGARRRLDLQGLLDGAREGEAVGHGGIAGDAGNDAGGALDVSVGQQAVDALVHVAQPLLQPRHGLAVDGEAEMAGLDDAGMHRPDRNLVQALALNRQEIVGGRIAPRRRRSGAERRAHAPGAVIEPGPTVGRAERRKAIEIAHRTLEPDRRRVEPSDGGEVGDLRTRTETTQGVAAPATRSARCTLSFSPHRPSRSPPPSPSACAIAVQVSWSTS